MAGEWSASHSTMCSVQTVREAICGAVSAGSRERCKLTREAQWLVRIGSTCSHAPKGGDRSEGGLQGEVWRQPKGGDRSEGGLQGAPGCKKARRARWTALP
eukprot:1060868-Prymnesium_polylepis.1